MSENINQFGLCRFVRRKACRWPPRSSLHLCGDGTPPPMAGRRTPTAVRPDWASISPDFSAVFRSFFSAFGRQGGPVVEPAASG